MRTLITASSLVTAIALSAERKAPAEIVFIPEGANRIFPLSHKDGIMVNVAPEKGEAITASLNTAIQKRMADDVKPWMDFEHTRKSPASGYPTGFRYEPGKGIMASIDWSGTGRRAVEDRDVCYFSPEFTVDDNGVPDGLPSRGPLGGLVAEPAFRKGMTIAAADSHEPNQPPIMSKLIFAALSIAASADTAETDAVRAIEKLQSDNRNVTASLATAEKERDELKEKVAAAEKLAADTRKDRADTLVQAAIADGRILPKDEETAKGFREQITAGSAFAEGVLAKLPKVNPDLTKKVVNIAAGQGAGTGTLEDRAKQLITAGDAKNIDEAHGIIFASDADAYAEYLASLAN